MCTYIYVRHSLPGGIFAPDHTQAADDREVHVTTWMEMPEDTESGHPHANGDMKLEECIDCPSSDVESVGSAEGEAGDANAKIEHMTQRNGYQRVKYQKIPQRTRTEELNWDKLDKRLTKLVPKTCVVHSLSRRELPGISERNVDENQNTHKEGVCTFAGRRDVSSPDTLQERSIVSRRGSVRGYQNRVRAGIATFLDQGKDKQVTMKCTSIGKKM